MPRCGRFRTFIQEYNESSKTEKLSFIPPFFILIIEIILLIHAIILDEIFVIILTTSLLIISIVEIILVSDEIHEHYIKSNFDRILTIRLDDFITKTKEKNVKKIVTKFLDKYPKYSNKRNEIYHTSCQIMKTHKEEKIEEEISKKLEKFIDKRKTENVDDIIEKFVKKYPKYKGFRTEIYELVCHIKTDSEINKNS